MENLEDNKEENLKIFFEYHEKENEKGPAPGDVSIF